ncbi:MAG TPA: TonB family protein [Terriglobales bacterium]|jgi:TonB family protein|nr:TonB family protein [Terriglobales bacterium]
MKRNFITLCCLAFTLASVPSVGQRPAEIAKANADEHLVKRIGPEYPPLARAARLQGKVLLKATISKDGDVTAVAVVSGHPMLIPSAVEAIKKWQYKPFLVDGQPAVVTTEIEVPFSLGISEEDYKKQQDASNDYFKQEKKCRDLLHEQQYLDAEQTCRPLIELAAKLPSERRLERLSAYQYAGHADFGQRKFSEALGFYKQELEIAEVALKPSDAELAYAYRDVAHGLHGTGDLQQARPYYEHAISTLEQARDHIDSAFLKNEYSRTMKTVLQEYALLLRKSGDSSGADAAEQRAQSIEVKTDLKDN